MHYTHQYKSNEWGTRTAGQEYLLMPKYSNNKCHEQRQHLDEIKKKLVKEKKK